MKHIAIRGTEQIVASTRHALLAMIKADRIAHSGKHRHWKVITDGEDIRACNLLTTTYPKSWRGR